MEQVYWYHLVIVISHSLRCLRLIYLLCPRWRLTSCSAATCAWKLKKYDAICINEKCQKIIPFVSVEDRATVRKHMLTNCFQLHRCSLLRDDLSGPYAPWWQFADLNWVITNLKASGLSLTVTMMADGCILPSFYRKLCMLALWSSLYHSKLKNVFRYNYLYDIKSGCYEREYIGKNSHLEEGKKRKEHCQASTLINCRFIFFNDYTVQFRHLQLTHTHPYECTYANLNSMSLFEDWADVRD